MSFNKFNAMWKIVLKYVNLLKILLLTVIRHHFPGHRIAINLLKRMKQIEEPIVTISSGKLRGKTERNFDNGLFYSFQGIPYGKPPLGSLRFKEPQPAEPWTGIRDATHEGMDCLSRHTVLRTLIGGEDCLSLNVYTPDLPVSEDLITLKAVMVWIHGGGFTSGSGSTEVYGPEFLLTEDVVLVTINYRTGILGFLSLQDPELEIPGNAGLKDIVMALKWVQENIIHFYGDPNNVTVFGESAGAAATHYLILSPMSKGLFHKAILQSGSALSGWARGRVYSEELAKVLGLDPINEKELLKTLRKLPADQLYKAAEKVPDPFLVAKIRPHGPVVENISKGAFLHKEPLHILKSGKYNHVPIMIGFTTREGMLGEILQRPHPFKPITNFQNSVPYFLKIPFGSETCKQIAEKIKQFYYGNEKPSTKNKDKYYLLETDNFFVREILSTVKLHRNTSSLPVFLYKMSIETSLNMLKKIYHINEPGVCHADDLGYLFQNLLTPNIEPESDEEMAMRRFVQLWTNFAKYGNPNPKKHSSLINVNWKPVEKNELNFLEIGKDLTAGINPESERMAFWKEIFDNYSTNPKT